MTVARKGNSFDCLERMSNRPNSGGERESGEHEVASSIRDLLCHRPTFIGWKAQNLPGGAHIHPHVLSIPIANCQEGDEVGGLRNWAGGGDWPKMPQGEHTVAQ